MFILPDLISFYKITCFNLAPFSISLAPITKANYITEKKHYHTKHQKVLLPIHLVLSLF